MFQPRCYLRSRAFARNVVRQSATVLRVLLRGRGGG
jgi:hypothetical protein